MYLIPTVLRFLQIKFPTISQSQFSMLFMHSFSQWRLHCISAIIIIGVAKAEVGNFTEAIRLFSLTLELDPSHEAARRHLEQAKQQLGSTATTTNTRRNRR